ncbi:MAG TPA: cytochrome c [Rhizomicrobium sp.]|nr:cytochrome c [Rhizomicrobium sp.]
MPLRLSFIGLFLALALPAGADQAALVARGAYLAEQGDCAACHTRPGGQPFAGGYPLHAWIGAVYSSNITPDRKTGIGNWTRDDFYRALHEGLTPEGKRLYPAFPYPYFTKLSWSDSDALLAYLQTIKPVRYRPPANRLIVGTGFRPLLWFWNLLFLDRTPLKPDPTKSAQWNRGNELVNGIAHCGGCHTPKNVLFAEKKDRPLKGDFIDGWFASDLTQTARGGLKSWSEEDIKQFLKTGANRYTRVVGSMQDVIRLSTSRMHDTDIAAIAAYLKSLPGSATPPPQSPNPKQMSHGAAVFVQECAACHAAPGNDYPKFGGNTIVVARNPATVIRVILRGAQAVVVPGQPPGFSMPAFAMLTDQQAADVATYIRNSWGNRASAVSAKEVAHLRNLITPRD